MQRRRFLRAATMLACTIALPTRAQDYPTKSIRILVGFPPGQATDIVARLLAEHLQQQLGQPVVVDNKPGQGGSIALAALAHAPADGYTLMLSATASLVVNPHLYNTVGYDTLKDFTPIATAVDLPLVLVAHPDQPFDSVAQLRTHARQHPGVLAHSSSGNGTLSHLGMEVIKRQAQIEMVHVPYQGSARAMMDLVAGTIHLGLDTVAVTLPHIHSGRMKALAVSSTQRLPMLPDTPTLEESGIQGASFSAWLALVAPRGTPSAIVERLSAGVLRVVQADDTAQRLTTFGAFPRPGSASDLRALLNHDYARWGAAVREAGLRVD